MGEHKNTILAIVLSLLVVVGWQYFVGYPQMEKQRQEALLKQQEQTQTQPGATQLEPRPQTGARRRRGAPPQVPGTPTAPAAQPQTLARGGDRRLPAHRRSRRRGCAARIDLKGGRIDDLSLTQYRETIDPEFAGRSCCSRRRARRTRSTPSSAGCRPSGTTATMPGPDTVWKQEGCGRSASTIR